MFDLKAKLLEKGLVTKEQVEQAIKEKVFSDGHSLAKRERIKALELLKSQSKAEKYSIIRQWVEKHRLDQPNEVDIDDEKFFFEVEGQLTWLTLKKDVIEALKNGQAGIIAYMSNHGLTHAVVKRDIVLDAVELFPSWLRVLNDQI